MLNLEESVMQKIELLDIVMEVTSASWILMM